MNFGIIIILSVVFLLLSVNKWFRSRDNRMAQLYVVAVAIVIGLRTSTPDTGAYLDYFEKLSPGDWTTMAWYYFEPGFQFFAHGIKMLFGFKPVVFLFTMALLTGLLVYDASRRIFGEQTCNGSGWIKCPVLLSLIFFYAYYGLFYSAITIRAGVSLGFYLEILSLFITGISGKRFMVALLYFLLAFSFHTSSVLIIPIMILYCLGRRFSKPSYLLVLAVSTLIFFSRLNLLFIDSLSALLGDFMTGDVAEITRVGNYTNVVKDVDEGLSYKYMFQLAAGYLILVVDLKKPSFYKLYNIYILGVLMGSMLAPISMAYRVLDYFYVVGYILLVQLFMARICTGNYFFVALSIVLFQIILVYRVCNG